MYQPIGFTVIIPSRDGKGSLLTHQGIEEQSRSADGECGALIRMPVAMSLVKQLELLLLLNR